MKRVVIVVSIICSVFLFVGCGSNNPEAVVKKYYAAADKGDIKGMQKFLAPEASSLLDGFIKYNEKETKKSLADEAKKGKFKIKSTTEKIEGDKATVTVILANGKTETEKLTKIDGKWKLTLGK